MPEAVLPEPSLRLLADAIGEDAEALAALHDHELTPSMIAALREAKFPSCLGLLPTRHELAAAWGAMSEAMSAIQDADDPAAIDALAAEYAAIYLTAAYGVSPCESFWTDDDHLHCQNAMFELREIYARAGLRAADWRHRPDDHLVLQLLFIAHAARHGRGLDDWRTLATMLDEHLLGWMPDFASRVAQRTSATFYAALAALTAAWLDTLRDVLAAALGEPRPSRQELLARRELRRARHIPAPVHFVPGANGPSW